MNLLRLPKNLLRTKLTQMALLTSIGGYVSQQIFKWKRSKWEKLSPDSLDQALDYITAFDLARGAGRLLEGWLLWNKSNMSLKDMEKHLKAGLLKTDESNASDLNRACSRVIVSKALFYREGFKIKTCRYETYQREARMLLRKIPAFKNIESQSVFLAKPFKPEEMIAAAHHLLFTLGNDKLPDYISHLLAQKPNTDTTYMMRLLVLTFGIEDETQFENSILQWLGEYRDFKLKQSTRNEQWVNTSLAALRGDLPTHAGITILKRFIKK